MMSVGCYSFRGGDGIAGYAAAAGAPGYMRSDTSRPRQPRWYTAANGNWKPNITLPGGNIGLEIAADQLGLEREKKMKIKAAPDEAEPRKVGEGPACRNSR